MRDHFIRFYRGFPDPVLLLGATGTIEAANAAARELLARVDFRADPGTRLVDAVQEPAGFESYLRACASTAQFLPGSVVLAGPVPLACRADGAAVPNRDGHPPFVILRLRPKQQAIPAFVALNEKVAELKREIAERKRTEAALEEQRTWLHTTLSSIADGVIATDPEGRVSFMNPVAERLTGWPSAEAFGRTLDDIFPIVHQSTRAAVENPVKAVLRSGERVNLTRDCTLIARNGREIAVDDSAAPICDSSGRLIGVVLVFRDVTEARRSEEQLREAQKLESLGLLAGGIAHDFNNLLTGILGNASLAIDSAGADSAIYSKLTAIIDASERAAHLTRQMLAYSGRGQFVDAQIDLSEAAREIVPLIRMSIPKKVELEFDLSENLPRVDADPAQIQQLLMNLVINAGEAIGQDKAGVVVVSTRIEQIRDKKLALAPAAATIEPGRYIVLEVRDTGSGMDDETRSRIFDPFFTTKFTGRGLGLSAVLGIVRSQNGFVEVDTRPGAGTTFRVLFPAAEKADLPKTILVADDEQVVLDMATGVLERSGYRVLCAKDGHEAVSMYRAHPEVSAVVLDLTMPALSGVEVLREIQADSRSTPVVVMSGYARAEVVRRFSDLTVASFLQKPFRAAQLLEAVTGALNQQGVAGAP